MGAYLSTPLVEKKSEDFDSNEKFSYGVSGMQGWRIAMEDAHNCVPSLEDNTSLFGVYDGHGGSEVALYCSLHFAEVLREMDAYKKGDYKAALEDAFMEIDKILIKPEIIRELKVLADRDPDDGPPTEADFKAKEAEEDYEEDETKLLYEEATISIEELLARYGKAADEKKFTLEKMKQSADENKSEEELQMSTAMEKEHIEVEPSSSSSSQSSTTKTATSAKAEASQKPGSSSSHNGMIKKSGDEDAAGSSSSSAGPATRDNSQVNGPATLEIEDETAEDGKASKEPEDVKELEKDTKLEQDCANESGDATTKLKKVNAKVKPQAKVTSKIQTKLRPTKLQALVDEEDIEDDDDEDSDSEDGFDSDEAVEGSSDSEQDESSEEDEDDAEPNVLGFPPPSSSVEEPGKDSGTTAVVAFLNGRDLYVANAGDSRCVLSRQGKAMDMSEDHKPEDETEMKRIKAAGGHVNFQGRVNGGLNLSRAIGDHCYKTNKELELKDQMISAMPDVRKVRLLPGDEFMVLACDGIWNVFSSQEVVDFVQVRLSTVDEKNDFKLSSICEELFDISLAPDTMGDGTGCDNMTCILIRFSQAWLEKCEVEDPTPREEMLAVPDGPNKDVTKDKADTNSLEHGKGMVGETAEEGATKKKSVAADADPTELNSGDNGKTDVKPLLKACKRSRTDDEDEGAGLTNVTEENEGKRPKVA